MSRSSLGYGFMWETSIEWGDAHGVPEGCYWPWIGFRKMLLPLGSLLQYNKVCGHKV